MLHHSTLSTIRFLYENLALYVLCVNMGMGTEKQRRSLGNESHDVLDLRHFGERLMVYLDHCETNREAYEDIAPLMEIYAKAVGKPRSDIRIYDPYYCNGCVEIGQSTVQTYAQLRPLTSIPSGVKRHLREVGFPNVLNDCVDFYTSPRKPDEFGTSN